MDFSMATFDYPRLWNKENTYKSYAIPLVLNCFLETSLSLSGGVIGEFLPWVRIPATPKSLNIRLLIVIGCLNYMSYYMYIYINYIKIICMSKIIPIYPHEFHMNFEFASGFQSKVHGTPKFLPTI